MTAERIFFVGKAIKIIEAGEDTDGKPRSSVLPPHFKESCLATLRNAFANVPDHAQAVQEAVHVVYDLVGRSLWRNVTQQGDLLQKLNVFLFLSFYFVALAVPNRLAKNQAKD